MLRLRLLLTLIIAGVLTLPLQAATITVADAGADYTSIQAAIDAAVSGQDEVVVSPGTYVENIDFLGKPITVRSASGDPADTIIDGGGNGSVVTCDSGETSTTVLDGFTIINGSGSHGGGMYNHFSSPTVTNCTFSENTAVNGGGMYNEYGNPTVTNCTFSSNTASLGGGMYNHNSSPTVTNCTFSGNEANEEGGGMSNHDSSPTVTNCTFSGNMANEEGGGMRNRINSNPTVTNCTFSGNTAHEGGGMYNNDSNPTVTNCTFSSNTANLGGGMSNHNSSPTVIHCSFSGNTANHSGGGMHNYKSSSTVTNCTFSGNTADYFGGGIEINSSSTTVINCTFSGNTANTGGGMDSYKGSPLSPPTVTNCILWGNSPDEIYNSSSSTTIISYSDLQGGLPANTVDGGGNIAVDPLFVDADGPDNTAGTGDDNLRLLGSSPCIDAADTTALPVGVFTDLDGNPRGLDYPLRVNTGIGVDTMSLAGTVFADMGAYEFQVPPCSSLPGDINCDGIVNMLDQALLALHWMETN